MAPRSHAVNGESNNGGSSGSRITSTDASPPQQAAEPSQPAAKNVAAPGVQRQQQQQQEQQAAQLPAQGLTPGAAAGGESAVGRVESAAIHCHNAAGPDTPAAEPAAGAAGAGGRPRRRAAVSARAKIMCGLFDAVHSVLRSRLCKASVCSMPCLCLQLGAATACHRQLSMCTTAVLTAAVPYQINC